MKHKALGLATIAVMLLLVLIQLQEDVAQDITEHESLFLLPDLKAALESASEIQILGGDNESRVTIVNQGGDWHIQEKAGYPADFETLSRLSRDMVKLKVAERKTTRVENHAQLGLASESDSMAVIVRISADRTYEMMIGHTSRTHGTFVRRPGEDQVYLVEQTIDVSTDPIDYLDPVFLSLESSEVETVVIRTRDSLLKAVRDEKTGKMVIEDIPEGAELRYDTVADSLARIFINLRFNDVKPYRADLFSEPGETSVTTSSGELRTIRSENIDGTYWVQLDQDWQYKVSEFTYNELNKSMEDMLKTEPGDED